MPRPSRRTALAVVAAIAVAVIAVGLPLFQPWRLFTDTVVEESLPGSTPVSTPSSSSPAPTVSGATGPTSPSRTSPAGPRGPVTIARGSFVTHEHHTTGAALIVRLPDGSRVLRLEGLDTSDGPDLKVWLTDAAVREGRAGWHVFDDGRHLNLGDLKGNKGSQNYPIPADAKLDGYRSVSIWCDRFNVSFGAAELTAT
jgi:Electron transfer DM13